MSFLEIFKMLYANHTQTQLLEACEWDEDRAAFVTESLEKATGKILQDITSPLTPEEIREKIVSELSGLMTSQEIITLRDILEREVFSFQSPGEKYEN